MALILLSPLTITLPLLTSVSSHSSTTYSIYRETTMTYTVAVMRTYFGSTKATALVQVPMDLPPKGIGFLAAKGKCGQYVLPFTVTNGTALILKITSTNPANLYLLPTYTFQTSPNGCSLLGSAVLAANNFTAYTMHWVAPEESTFYILFTGPTTVIILKDQGSTHPVIQDTTTTYATSTETNFNEYSSTSTTTYTTATTSTHPLYLQLPTLSSLEIVALLITCLGITLVAVFRERGR